MGRAYSGGPYVFAQNISGTSAPGLITGLKDACVAAGWQVTGVPAQCTGSGCPLPTNGDYVLLEGRTYTFRTAMDDTRAGDVLIGATATDCVANLVAAINHAAGAGTRYSSATAVHDGITATSVGNAITVTARQVGPAYNGRTCTGFSTWRPTWQPSIPTWGDFSYSNTFAFGGYRVLAKSPQNQAIQVYLYLFDPNDGHGLRARFESVAPGGPVGYGHLLRVGVGLAYQAIVHPCQIFVSQSGVMAHQLGSTFSGGILRLNEDPCGELKDNGPPVWEAWWSQGDYYGSGFAGQVATSPRTNLLYLRFLADALGISVNGNYSSCACWNGVYTGPASGGNTTNGTMQILAITGPANIDVADSSHWVLSQMKLWGDRSLELDPLVKWGDTYALPGRLRGQLWDSYIDTEPADMDTTYTDDNGLTWLNMTHRFFYGSLWVITGAPVAAAGVLEGYVY